MQAHLKRLWVMIFGFIGLLSLSFLFFKPLPRAEQLKETGYSEAQFFKQVVADVKPLAKSYGIKPSVLLAHLAIETDYGQTLLFQNYQNAYGLKPKAGQEQVQLLTATYRSGSGQAKKMSFAVYGRWQDSVRDYLARLKAEDKNQYRLLATTDKPKEAATVLAKLSRRQTADYAKRLTDIISEHELSKYDK